MMMRRTEKLWATSVFRFGLCRVWVRVRMCAMRRMDQAREEDGPVKASSGK